MPRITLVGVGHVSLDHVFRVAAPPQRGLKTPALAHRTLVGGMTANAVVAAARLGAAARIVSPVGADAAGARFAAHFEHEGVDASGLLAVAGAHSSTSAVIVDAEGERTIVNHRGDALARCPPLDLARLEGADVLLADPRCPSWAESALRWAAARGLPSVFDGDTAPGEHLRRLAARAAWAVFSAPGLAAWCADGAGGDHQVLDAEQTAAALAAVLAAGAQVAVVTRGEQGAWVRRSEGESGVGPMRWIPPHPAQPVVDSTAAGDVFHGALGVALAEGAGDDAALAFASTAAALKCLRPDAVLGAPSRAEVSAAMAGGSPGPWAAP